MMGSTRTQTRTDILKTLGRKLNEICLKHPLRVGIDGISASGKTVFADDLATVLRDTGREVVRTGLDGFHNPPEIRYRLGSTSVEGYMQDSFDYTAVRRCVLVPLGPKGTRSYKSKVFDHVAEAPSQVPSATVSQNAILLFEGVMLFNEELDEHFDYRILVQTSFEIALERAKVRDLRKFGSLQILCQKYSERFFPGQKRYLAECRPEKLAEVVIANDDWENPTIEFKTIGNDLER